MRIRNKLILVKRLHHVSVKYILYFTSDRSGHQFEPSRIVRVKMELMELPEKNDAKTEIHDTLRSVNFFVGIIGIPLINLPETPRDRFKMYLNLIFSVLFNFGIASGQYVCIAHNVAKANSVVDFVGSNLHIAGYGLMSKLI